MTPGQKGIEEPFHRLEKRAILAGKGKLRERFLLVQPFAGEQANVRLVSLATPVHQVLGLFLDLLSSLRLFARLWRFDHCDLQQGRGKTQGCMSRSETRTHNFTLFCAYLLSSSQTHYTARRW